MLKQLLAVVAGVALTLAVFAAEDVELRADHPDVYVVQRGDTLWDIAGKFLTKPWLWPEIWQANPQVQNPHRIYPGDRLSLAYLNGRPYLQNTGGPQVRRESLAEAIKPISLGEIQPFLEDFRLMDEAEVKRQPYVVALEEDRLRATTGQLAYVRGADLAPGTKVVIARPTYAYYDVPVNYPWDTEYKLPEALEWTSHRGRSMSRWWNESVWVWRGKQRHTDYLGHEVLDIAQGEVLRGGDPATVLIQYGDVEIREGDLVLTTPSMPFDLEFYPRAPAAVPDNMRVMAFADALAAVGPKQVVALNRGARHGVENGHVFSIFEPGQVIRDDVAYSSADFRTTFSNARAMVELPPEFIGHVMIFRTFDGVSYGLIMDGIRPVKLGDVLREPLR